MGKKSKRPGRSNRSKSNRIQSVLDYTKDSESTLLYENELVALAEKDPNSAIDCYGRLAASYTYPLNTLKAVGDSKAKAEHYIDKIIHRTYRDKTIKYEIAVKFLFMCLTLGNTEHIMKIYRGENLKGRLSTIDATEAMHIMRGYHVGGSVDPKYTSCALAILEDHIEMVETSLGMTREMYLFYKFMTLAYGNVQEYTKQRQYLKKQLIVTKNTGDEDGQFKTLQTMALNCRVRGEYDKAMKMLETCLNLLLSIKRSIRTEEKFIENVWWKANVISTMGDVVKRRSVTDHGVVMYSDAVSMLELYKEAADLILDCTGFDPESPVGFQRLHIEIQKVGRLYAEMGEYEKGIEELMRGLKIIRKIPTHGLIEKIQWKKELLETGTVSAFHRAGYICLQKFYHLKSLGEPFDDREILNRALDYTAHAYTMNPEWGERLLNLAQIQYFLNNTKEAFICLARHLDHQILYVDLSCGACGHDGNRKDIVSKVCSGCNLINYCSATCQSNHWKTNIAGKIRHKDMCGMIGFWHSTLKEKLKFKAIMTSDFSNWRSVKEVEDLMGEPYQKMFNSFFESFLKKEHGPVGFFDAMD